MTKRKRTNIYCIYNTLHRKHIRYPGRVSRDIQYTTQKTYQVPRKGKQRYSIHYTENISGTPEG
jgi:hypothetical protein